jgi:hypothetical protein
MFKKIRVPFYHITIYSCSSSNNTKTSSRIETAQRSEPHTVFDRSNDGIVSSKPTRDNNLCLYFLSYMFLRRKNYLHKSSPCCCMSAVPFQILKLVTNFHEICYQNYASGGNPFNATLYIIPYNEEGANFWGQSDSYSSCMCGNRPYKIKQFLLLFTEYKLRRWQCNTFL